MKNKRKIGEKGEQWAVDFLTGKGYQIIERNLQVGHLEIDIVAKHKNWLIFVEVKLRGDAEHGLPEDNAGKSKQNYLLKAADFYLNDVDWQGKVRFDLISIIISPFEIVHFEDAFY
jgi:putative endonuclease